MQLTCCAWVHKKLHKVLLLIHMWSTAVKISLSRIVYGTWLVNVCVNLAQFHQGVDVGMIQLINMCATVCWKPLLLETFAAAASQFCFWRTGTPAEFSWKIDSDTASVSNGSSISSLAFTDPSSLDICIQALSHAFMYNASNHVHLFHRQFCADSTYVTGPNWKRN